MLIGPFAGAVLPFRALMTRWLTQVSFPVNRIAFGTNVLLSAPSKNRKTSSCMWSGIGAR